MTRAGQASRRAAESQRRGSVGKVIDETGDAILDPACAEASLMMAHLPQTRGEGAYHREAGELGASHVHPERLVPGALEVIDHDLEVAGDAVSGQVGDGVEGTARGGGAVAPVGAVVLALPAEAGQVVAGARDVGEARLGRLGQGARQGDGGGGVGTGAEPDVGQVGGHQLDHEAGHVHLPGDVVKGHLHVSGGDGLEGVPASGIVHRGRIHGPAPLGLAARVVEGVALDELAQGVELGFLQAVARRQAVRSGVEHPGPEHLRGGEVDLQELAGEPGAAAGDERGRREPGDRRRVQDDRPFDPGERRHRNRVAEVHLPQGRRGLGQGAQILGAPQLEGFHNGAHPGRLPGRPFALGDREVAAGGPDGLEDRDPDAVEGGDLGDPGDAGPPEEGADRPPGLFRGADPMGAQAEALEDVRSSDRGGIGC